jgi:hypothetical protein
LQANQKSTVAPLPAGGLLQRKCDCGQHTIAGAACSECGKKKISVQRAARNSEGATQKSGDVPPIVHEVLRSSGQPLDAATRAFFESRFGHDFSRVRVHSDARAAESARSVNALAYTVSHNVVFASGQYAPHFTAGRRLLAHELTHVVQQSGHQGTVQAMPSIGCIDDVYEQEADQIADHVTDTRSERVGSISSGSGAQLQRKCKPLSRGLKFEWELEYDGCSGPDGLFGRVLENAFHPDNPAKGKDTQFAEAIPSLISGKPCDRHDECYQTCHHGDESAKEKCDKRMVEDMIDICFDAKGKESKKCFRWAKIFRWILREHAGKAYRDRQEEVCRCTQLLQVPLAERVKRASVAESLEDPK